MQPANTIFVASLLVALTACASGAGHAQPAKAPTPPAPQNVGGGSVVPVRATLLPASAQQGALVIGTTHMAATVEYAGKTLRVSPSGRFAFAIGRDATGSATVKVKQPGTGIIEHRIMVSPRDWPIEKIDGVPPATVNGRPEAKPSISIAKRLRSLKIDGLRGAASSSLAVAAASVIPLPCVSWPSASRVP